MKVHVEVKGLDAALKMLAPDNVLRAGRRTLDRAISSARTEASRQIRAKYVISKMDLDRYLKRKTISSAEALSAALSAEPSFGKARIPLIRFKVKQQGKAIKRAKGRSVSLRRTRSRQGAVQVQVRTDRGWKTIPKAFVTQMKSGHIGVFERIPGSRMPSHGSWKREKIRELTTVDVPLMFAEKGVMEATKEKAVEAWEKNLPYYIDQEMKR